MKPGCVLSLTIVYLALMHGLASASSSDAASQGASSQGSASADSGHSLGNAPGASGNDARQPTNGKPSAEGDHNPVSGTVHSRSKVTTATVPKQPIRDPKHVTQGRSAIVRPQDSSESNGAQKGASTQDQSVSRALPVRAPMVASPVDPFHVGMRHHSPNPAVVGGSANSKAGNREAINGTHTGRRP